MFYYVKVFIDKYFILNYTDVCLPISFFLNFINKCFLSTDGTPPNILGIPYVRVHPVPDRPALVVPVFLELPTLAPDHHLHSRHHCDGCRLSGKLLFV